MRTAGISWIAAVCLALAGSSGAALAAAKPPLYLLHVGTVESLIKPENLGKIGSPGGSADYGGQLLFSLNGNPFKICSGGAMVYTINQWLRDGDNTISVSGQHTKPVYLRIDRLKQDAIGNSPADWAKAFEKVVFTAAVPAAEGEKSEQSFTAKLEVPYTLPAFDELRDPAAAKKELREVIARFDADSQARNAAGARAFLCAGRAIWFKSAYGGDPEKVFGSAEQWAAIYKDPTRKDEPIALDKLQFVFGKSAVAVFAGQDEKTGRFLRKSAVHGRVTPTAAQIMVRIGGKWMVWDEMF